MKILNEDIRILLKYCMGENIYSYRLDLYEGRVCDSTTFGIIIFSLNLVEKIEKGKSKRKSVSS